MNRTKNQPTKHQEQTKRFKEYQRDYQLGRGLDVLEDDLFVLIDEAILWREHLAQIESDSYMRQGPHGDK